MDKDNLFSSFKAIIDGLQDAGIILNDSAKIVTEWECYWEKTSVKGGFVTVVVKALE